MNRFASLLLIFLLFAGGCAKQLPHERASGIGPYTAFDGRLIVIEPKRRWQVTLNWQAEAAEQGALRLTHAATGTVIEFRWHGEQMQLRGGQLKDWQVISSGQLLQHGIILPPHELAAILLGNMPTSFIEKKAHLWERQDDQGVVRLQWFAETRKLVMTDISHGLIATLMINQP